MKKSFQALGHGQSCSQGFPGGSAGKEFTETQVQSLVWEDPLGEEMAPHSSTLPWRIPWTEEPTGLQSMGLQRAGQY